MSVFKTGTYTQLMPDSAFDVASTTDQEFLPRTVDNMKMGVFVSTAISDALAGYGKGCIAIVTADGKLYTNVGSATSCDFDAVS